MLKDVILSILQRETFLVSITVFIIADHMQHMWLRIRYSASRERAASSSKNSTLLSLRASSNQLVDNPRNCAQTHFIALKCLSYQHGNQQALSLALFFLKTLSSEFYWLQSFSFSTVFSKPKHPLWRHWRTLIYSFPFNFSSQKCLVPSNCPLFRDSFYLLLMESVLSSGKLTPDGSASFPFLSNLVL